MQTTREKIVSLKFRAANVTRLMEKNYVYIAQKSDELVWGNS